MIKKTQIKPIEKGIEIQRNLTISAFLHFANNCLLWKRWTIFDFIPTKCRMKWTIYNVWSKQPTKYKFIRCNQLSNIRLTIQWKKLLEEKRWKWNEMKIELRNTTSIRNNYIKIILNSSRSYQIDVSMAHFQHRIDFVLLLLLFK